MKAASILILILIATTALTAWGQPNVPCYSVTDLGPATPDAINLNNGGQLVGQTERWNGNLRAFSSVAAFTIPLPTLGGPTSSAHSINNAGAIAGMAQMADGSAHPVIWWKYKPVDLGLQGGTWGIAVDINDAGDIASCIDGRLVAWIKGQVKDISIEGAFMWPTAINARGDILSLVVTNDGVNHADLYRAGQWIELAQNALPTDLNDRGVVCGGRGFDTGWNGFIYDSESWIDMDPTSRWYFSTCNGLNNAGIAVGTIGTADGDHAFLWRNSEEGELDLNNMIPKNSGMTLTGAYKINDRGQIAAYASVNGTTHAVLLVPRACH